MILLRIFINLYFMLRRSLIMPGSLFRKHGFSLVVVVGLFALFQYLFAGSEQNAPFVPPQNVPGVPKNTDKDKGDVPIPAGGLLQFKAENGNSPFAADLLVSMKKNELAYYSSMFYWVMNSQASNAPHSWDFFEMSGTITPTSNLKNNLGQTCRNFKEILNVHGTQQAINGVACPQRGGGWCKLRINSAPACDLGRNPGIRSFINDTQRSLGDLFR